MVAPEVPALSASRSRIRRQSEQLGPLSRGEKNVLFVLTVMLALWLLPTLATVEFLDIWYVPPVGMVLLFLLPVDAGRGEMTLDRNDLQEGVAWNVLFLVVGGMALVSGLTGLGVTDWIGGAVTGNVTATALPWLAGLLTTVLTQLASGVSTTVMVSSMLFPIAEALEYNAAILARIVAGTAHAVALPWSSPTAATTFRCRRRPPRDHVQSGRGGHRSDVNRRRRAEHDPGAGVSGIRRAVNQGGRRSRPRRRDGARFTRARAGLVATHPC